MTMESKLMVLRHRLGDLSPHQRDNALDFLVGILSAHVSMDVWHSALDAAVDLVTGPHGAAHPPPPSGKDAAVGPDR